MTWRIALPLTLAAVALLVAIIICLYRKRQREKNQMCLEEETVHGAKMQDPEASRSRNLPLHGMQGPQRPPPQLEGSSLSRPSSGTAQLPCTERNPLSLRTGNFQREGRSSSQKQIIGLTPSISIPWGDDTVPKYC